MILLFLKSIKDYILKYFFVFFLLFPGLILAQADFKKAEQFFQKGKYAEAKEMFLELYKKKPSEVKIIEYLGDIESHSKNWDNALEYYEKLKKQDPFQADYVYKYGGALGMKASESNKFKALGMIDEIEESFIKAIKLDAKHVGARWALIELYLQLPAIVGGSEKKAQKYASELLKISPVDGYLSKGHIAEYFKRYTEAEKNYKKAVEIGGSKTTYQKLADLYKNKMKQPEKAKATLEEYTEKSKT